MGASSELGHPFRPRKKIGLGKSRLSHYDIRAEGTLLPNITVIRVKKLANVFAVFP